MALLTLLSCAAAWQSVPLAAHAVRPAARMVLVDPNLMQIQAASALAAPRASEPIKRYSSSDWIESLRSTPWSIVWNRVSHRVQFQTVLATLVVGARSLGFRAALPPLIHTLLGGFLGLLLVFRTNAATGGRR